MQDFTIEQVNDAAERNAEEYDTLFRKAARAAFIEGVLWAQKTHREGGLS